MLTALPLIWGQRTRPMLCGSTFLTKKTISLLSSVRFRVRISLLPVFLVPKVPLSPPRTRQETHRRMSRPREKGLRVTVLLRLDCEGRRCDLPLVPAACLLRAWLALRFHKACCIANQRYRCCCQYTVPLTSLRGHTGGEHIGPGIVRRLTSFKLEKKNWHSTLSAYFGATNKRLSNQRVNESKLCVALSCNFQKTPSSPCDRPGMPLLPACLSLWQLM